MTKEGMNPPPGTRARGKAIGFGANKGSNMYEWVECPGCKVARWVRVVKDKPVSLRCHACNNGLLQKGNIGGKSPGWRGGRRVMRRGYIRLWVAPDSFFYSMASKDGYILEHRLVMAQALRRCLHAWELVHHKNGNKADNRLANLQLVSDERHYQITVLEERIKRLEARVILLEAENAALSGKLNYV